MIAGTRLARATRVPSFLHEILVELFRQRPALAPELLRACAGIRLESATTELGSIDLSQVAEMRRLFDPTGHYHRPDVFSLNVDTRTRSAVTTTS